MKKCQWLFFCILLSFLMGCSQNREEGDAISSIAAMETMEMMEEATQAESQTESESETETKTEYKKLTIEAVAGLADQHESLTLEDFASYMDISLLESEGYLSKELSFIYNDKEYCLRVLASDKSYIAAQYEGALDAAVLFEKEFLYLSPEQEYAYEGGCADIRAGVLAHILDGTVTMGDYLTCEMPSGLTESRFCYWLGSRGGCIFLAEDRSEEDTAEETAGMFDAEDEANPLHGGIEIRENGELGHGILVTEEYDSLAVGDAIIRREQIQVENGYTWYVARIGQENSTIEYWVYLNQQLYSQEEFLHMTETIEIKEHAIY